MGVQAKTIVRKGSLVTFNPEKVKDHPVFSKFIGKNYKVDRVEPRHAVVGSGSHILHLPLILLDKVPQKKGKAKEVAA